MMASSSVRSTSLIDSLTTCGGVKGDGVLHAGREALGQALQLGAGIAIDGQGVGGGQLRDGEADGFVAVEAQIRGVGFGAQLGAAHVADAHQRAVGAGLENDVFEFRGLDHASDGADADLIVLAGVRRRLADAAGRHLHVLFLQRAQDVGGGEAAAGQTHRVQPQAHGVLSFAEDDHVGDARHALDGVADVHVQIIAEEEAVVFAVLGVDAGGEDEAGGGLGDVDAGGADFDGQAAQRGVDAILHVHGGEVDIAGDVEGDGDGAGAVVAGVRGHVLHALDAVDLLLDGSGDGGFHGLRVGAGIEAGDGHLSGAPAWGTARWAGWEWPRRRRE